MANIFFGLNIGRSALLAHQTALDVTGHNLANVNTEGYSRQRVDLEAALPSMTPQGSIGSGVNADRIQRMHLDYLERHIARTSSDKSYATVLSQGLEQIEAVLDEPSDQGLGAALTEFWNAWDALAARPADLALRAQALDRAQNLARVYNDKIGSLRSLESRFDEAAGDMLDDVNALLGELADLNHAVARAEAGRSPANDLRDQRDRVVRQIAEKIGIEVEEKESFLNVKVAGGGPYLVYGAQALEIEAERDDRGFLTGFHVDTAPITVDTGELGAMLALRDDLAPDLRKDLAEWMATITDRINALHRQGTDREGRAGRNLFVWSGEAETVAVAPSTGIRNVEIGAALETGTHRLEVQVTGFKNLSGRATLSGITLSAGGGTYTGPETIGLDYHAKVTSVDTANGRVTLRLYRGDEAVGEAQTASAGDTVTWTVDGKTFTADLDSGLDVSTLEEGDRTNGQVTTGTVSLDGGTAEPLDVTATGEIKIEFTGGGDQGFTPGGTATLYFTGDPFSTATFTVYGPEAELSVDPTVSADTDRLAAGYDPEGGTAAPGDGENARRIADIAQSLIFEAVDETAAGFLGRIVQSLGSRGRDARILEESQNTLLLQLEAQRESVSGVNLDEEMIRLIQYQRGFEAAARFLTTVDAMIETLINRVGLVGR